jgi:hypothetical protein
MDNFYWLENKNNFLMNYKQEKETEIEALESIYIDSLRKVDDDKYEIDIFPYSGEDEKNFVGLTLTITYTPKYPEEPLDYNLTSIRGLVRSDIDDLKEDLDKEVKEWLGSIYVFNLTSACQEFLIKTNDRQSNDDESELEKINREKDEERRKLDELTRYSKNSELNNIDAKGTPVTIEIFEKWKKEFDSTRVKKQQEDKSRLTGRQLFEQKSKWIDESFLTELEEKSDGTLTNGGSQEVFDEDLFLDQ